MVPGDYSESDCSRSSVHSYSGSKDYDGAEFLTKQIQNANVKIVHGGCSYCVLIIFIRDHDSHMSS